jgi:FkbM family methyltransferase
VRFTVTEASKIEYRAWISGKIPLQIDEYRRVTRVDDHSGEGATDAGEFPEAGPEAPSFFSENHALFRTYYERGMGVAIVGDAAVLTVNGISLYARSLDDLNFVGEIFGENAYNFLPAGDCCVIDVGMNIALASLSFAAKPEVREIHAFEPFASTFERAIDNIALNPMLATKITPHRVGLSDKDWSGELLVDRHSDSGAASVVSASGTDAVFIELHDAGTTLRPIVESARDRGLRIVVKIDCEGSEFAIFDSLDRAGLLPFIHAFMVEWHAMFDDKSQHTLIAPLHREGFIVFDRSPRVGNGFFYAARLAA